MILGTALILIANIIVIFKNIMIKHEYGKNIFNAPGTSDNIILAICTIVMIIVNIAYFLGDFIEICKIKLF